MEQRIKTTPLECLAAAIAVAVIMTPACAAKVALAEVRAIAKEGCVYGFPLVDNMRVHYF